MTLKMDKVVTLLDDCLQRIQSRSENDLISRTLRWDSDEEASCNKEFSDSLPDFFPLTDQIRTMLEKSRDFSGRPLHHLGTKTMLMISILDQLLSDKFCFKQYSITWGNPRINNETNKMFRNIQQVIHDSPSFRDGFAKAILYIAIICHNLASERLREPHGIGSVDLINRRSVQFLELFDCPDDLCDLLSILRYHGAFSQNLAGEGSFLLYYAFLSDVAHNRITYDIHRGSIFYLTCLLLFDIVEMWVALFNIMGKIPTFYIHAILSDWMSLKSMMKNQNFSINRSIVEIRQLFISQLFNKDKVFEAAVRRIARLILSSLISSLGFRVVKLGSNFMASLEELISKRLLEYDQLNIQLFCQTLNCICRLYYFQRLLRMISSRCLENESVFEIDKDKKDKYGLKLQLVSSKTRNLTISDTSEVIHKLVEYVSNIVHSIVECSSSMANPTRGTFSLLTLNTKTLSDDHETALDNWIQIFGHPEQVKRWVSDFITFQALSEVTISMKNTHVFISYVNEDWPIVSRLVSEIKGHGIAVWLDKHDIAPGMDWRIAIEKAIKEGVFFIACFSSSYSKKQRSYMNEELQIAIEQMRLMHEDRIWFIPVKLTPCKLPVIEIRRGKKLDAKQWVDLYQDWDIGMIRIIKILEGEVQENY